MRILFAKYPFLLHMSKIYCNFAPQNQIAATASVKTGSRFPTLNSEDMR